MRGLSATPSIAAMRPLVTAGPSARARTSPIAAESSTGGACAVTTTGSDASTTNRARFMSDLAENKKGGRDSIPTSRRRFSALGGRASRGCTPSPRSARRRSSLFCLLLFQLEEAVLDRDVELDLVDRHLRDGRAVQALFHAE